MSLAKQPWHATAAADESYGAPGRFQSVSNVERQVCRRLGVGLAYVGTHLTLWGLGSSCIYETKRAKPGMKAGAIDNLHRRLGQLSWSQCVWFSLT